jgi:hypothetical protein
VSTGDGTSFAPRLAPSALRAHLQSFGISLRSATGPADDTSTGKLMEGVLAAFAQFDNDVRSDRNRARMRAALETRTPDVPGAPWLLERTEVVEDKPRCGFRKLGHRFPEILATSVC